MTKGLIQISLIINFILASSMQMFAQTVTVTSITQLQTEINRATAGTEIIVKNGTYTTSGQISIRDRIGTENEPIIIRAETIGGVTIRGKDGFVTKGTTQYVTIKGFIFKHEAYHRLSNSASHCTFTRNVYECIKDSETGANTSSSYLTISGSNNEVSYNVFQNKNFRGPMLSLQGSNGKIATNNWVHHNHFKDFTTSDANNDNSAIQPGYGRFGTSKANMIIEHNLFENLKADAEGVMSAKCWDVTFRYNTVINCSVTSLRSGEEHIVHGNYFFNSKLRFADSNHKLYSNVFVGNSAGITLFSRLDATNPTGYSHIRPINCFIGFNTFVNNSKGFNSNGDGGSQDLKIVNNIFYNCAKAVEVGGAPMDGVLYDANIIWLGDKFDHPNSGLIDKDPMFEFDSNGVPSIKSQSPAVNKSNGSFGFVRDDMDGQSRTGTRDIGADELGKGNESVRVLSTNQVGPNAQSLPNISILEPNRGANITLVRGYSLYIKVDAFDFDGSISNVKLYIDDVLIRQESVAPYEWGHASSPNPNELNGLSPGQYRIKVTATDNDGASKSTSVDLIVTDSGPAGYTFSVNERGTVNVSGLVDIAYGANGQYHYLYNQTQDQVCDNNTFGDPISGIAKKCYIKPSTPTTIESVDAQQSPNVASNMLDGNTADASRWSTQTYSKSVVFDLGSVKPITGTKMWTYQDRAYKYRVQTSNSASSGFVTKADKTGNTSASQPLTTNFNVVEARYVKLTITGAHNYSGNWISITEFEIQLGIGGQSSAASKFSSNAKEASEDMENKVFIYPNPASQSFTVEAFGKEISEVIIYNLTGALVYRSINRTGKITIDEKFEAGVYFVRTTTKDLNFITKKLIIK